MYVTNKYNDKHWTRMSRWGRETERINWWFFFSIVEKARWIRLNCTWSGNEWKLQHQPNQIKKINQCVVCKDSEWRERDIMHAEIYQQTRWTNGYQWELKNAQRARQRFHTMLHTIAQLHTHRQTTYTHGWGSVCLTCVVSVAANVPMFVHAFERDGKSEQESESVCSGSMLVVFVCVKL